MSRVAEVLRARDAAAHEFFGRPGKAKVDAPPAEVGAYLLAVAPLLARRSLAVDAGAGDGRLLEVLAPLYERVVAVDRSEAQLARARERCAARGWRNVRFVEADVDAPDLAARVAEGDGADAVFASRLLHHAPRPGQVVARLASLVAPGGALVALDYARHDDESMRDQADAWLGFDPADLRRFARAAGLEEARVAKVPSALCGDGPDRHLPWLALFARKSSGGARQVARRRRR